MKKRCIIWLALAIALIIIPAAFSLSIQIKNLGQLGFVETNQEFTSLRTVVLELNYTSGAYCRFSNDNVTWSQFDFCVLQEYWLLSDSAGNKTVFVDMNLTNGSSYILNDSIYYNFTGAGLDTSPSTNVEITNDAFSNNNSSVSFFWSEAADPESNLLRIPIIYSYMILINGIANNSWTVVGTERNVTYNVNLSHNDNLTILVNATNSAGLNNESSSNIIIDLIPPNNTMISSGMNEDEWYSNLTVFFNWSSSDDLSGIGGFSYTLSTDSTIEPDDVPEGQAINPENHLNKTFTGLKTGNYMFKIKAIDEAGNFANITTYNIWIDTTPPSRPVLLSSEKIFGTNIINYTWSESYDEDSGIDFFTIEIWNNTDYNYSAIDTLLNSSNISNTTFNYEYAPLLNYSNFYARIKAVDEAGNPSIWSSGESLYDTTPPTIILITPQGSTEGDLPIIRLSTDEKANCYQDSGTLTIFDYTNSTYHETKPKSNVYTISCFDLSGNEASQDLSSSFSPDASLPGIITGIVLSTAYTGQIAYANLTLNNCGIEKTRFKAYLNDTEIDFTITDRGDGDYALWFIAPKVEGPYQLEVEVDSSTESETFTVNPLNLAATYEDSFTKQDFGRITYFSKDDYYAGFSSDSTDASPGSQDNLLSISALYDGKIYFFATRRIQNIEIKDKELKGKTFLTEKRPSFGYGQSQYNLISAALINPTIQISGNETLGIGGYNLLVKRVKNPEKKTVIVTSKASSYNEKGVVQYD